MEQIKTVNAPEAIGPYSQAVVCNDMLFVSGQIPIDPETGQIPKEIKEQTAQVMKNISAILKQAGVTFENVVKAVIYIIDLNDFAVVNQVYEGFLSPPFPARVCVEVSRLPKDVLIEIEVTAIIS